LWGNHGYEAAFFQVWVDAEGEQRNGSHRYEWTLPLPIRYRRSGVWTDRVTFNQGLKNDYSQT
jgi:hypothetical protein